MRKKIIVATTVAFVIGALLSPPEAISQLISGVTGGVLCATPLLVLRRFSFVQTASAPIHTLVCVLVCMVSVLAMFCYVLGLKIASDAKRYQSPPGAASQP